LDHLKYRHLEHPTIFPRCQPLSRGLATGAWFQFRAIAGGRRRPESPDVRLQQKIMIPMFRPRFRSRDAAFAAATRLTHLVPGHDYEAWPNRGYWVLVMRYRDDNGHIRFKFVGPADLLSKKHNIQEKTRPPERQQILSPDNLAAEGKPPASRKPEPHRRNPQERPVGTTSVTAATKASGDTVGSMPKRCTSPRKPLKRFPASAAAVFLTRSAGSPLPRSLQILRARKTLVRAHCPD
jgi:hypothetical protein